MPDWGWKAVWVLGNGIGIILMWPFILLLWALAMAPMALFAEIHCLIDAGSCVDGLDLFRRKLIDA